MAKREWGAKHTCMSCGVKFYDLHRNPVACPKCGSEIEAENARPVRRRSPVQATPPPPPSKEEAAIAGTDDEAADDDADDMIDDIDGDDVLVGNINEAETVQSEA